MLLSGSQSPKKNPPCPSHPTSEVLFYCQLCDEFLCVICYSEHLQKTGHAFSGKEYDKYIKERQELLQRLKVQKQDWEEKKRIYGVVEDLIKLTIDDYESNILKRFEIIDRNCQQYKERIQSIGIKSKEKLEEDKEKKWREFEEALIEVQNGNYGENLRVVQEFSVVREENEEEIIMEWIKEMRLNSTLGAFGDMLKKMYKEYKNYFKKYLENLAKLEVKKNDEIEEEEEEEEEQNEEGNNQGKKKDEDIIEEEDQKSKMKNQQIDEKKEEEKKQEDKKSRRIKQKDKTNEMEEENEINEKKGKNIQKNSKHNTKQPQLSSDNDNEEKQKKTHENEQKKKNKSTRKVYHDDAEDSQSSIFNPEEDDDMVSRRIKKKKN